MTDQPTISPNQVRALLGRRRMAQADLAAALDPPVTQSTVSRWLHGELTPAPDHAAQMLALLATAPRAPWGEPTADWEPAAVAATAPRPADAAAAVARPRLPPVTRDAILALVAEHGLRRVVDVVLRADHRVVAGLRDGIRVDGWAARPGNGSVLLWPVTPAGDPAGPERVLWLNRRRAAMDDEMRAVVAAADAEQGTDTTLLFADSPGGNLRQQAGLPEPEDA